MEAPAALPRLSIRCPRPEDPVSWEDPYFEVVPGSTRFSDSNLFFKSNSHHAITIIRNEDTVLANAFDRLKSTLNYDQDPIELTLKKICLFVIDLFEFKLVHFDFRSAAIDRFLAEKRSDPGASFGRLQSDPADECYIILNLGQFIHARNGDSYHITLTAAALTDRLIRENPGIFHTGRIVWHEDIISHPTRVGPSISHSWLSYVDHYQRFLLDPTLETFSFCLDTDTVDLISYYGKDVINRILDQTLDVMYECAGYLEDPHVFRNSFEDLSSHIILLPHLLQRPENGERRNQILLIMTNLLGSTTVAELGGREALFAQMFDPSLKECLDSAIAISRLEPAIFHSFSNILMRLCNPESGWNPDTTYDTIPESVHPITLDTVLGAIGMATLTNDLQALAMEFFTSLIPADPHALIDTHSEASLTIHLWGQLIALAKHHRRMENPQMLTCFHVFIKEIVIAKHGNISDTINCFRNFVFHVKQLTTSTKKQLAIEVMFMIKQANPDYAWFLLINDHINYMIMNIRLLSVREYRHEPDLSLALYKAHVKHYLRVLSDRLAVPGSNQRVIFREITRLLLT